MKKKLYILTFLISFICFAENVWATDLTCKYESTCTISNAGMMSKEVCTEPKMIVQRDDYLLVYHKDLDAQYFDNNPFWTVTKNYSFEDVTSYSKSTNTLSACPKCVINDTGKYTFKDKCGSGYLKLESESFSAEEIPNLCQRVIYTDKLKEEIENTTWNNECKYSDNISIYFNDSRLVTFYKVHNSYRDSCFTLSELKSVNNGFCPLIVYSDHDKGIYLKEVRAGLTSHSLRANSHDQSSDNSDVKITELNSCDDLISDDIRKIINDVMNIIRIAVPILLIVFGIIDFTKATFSGKEDEMKKHRDRFIKRIIAAIIVFLVPIFVNLVLTLANSVWSSISPETCIK